MSVSEIWPDDIRKSEERKGLDGRGSISWENVYAAFYRCVSIVRMPTGHCPVSNFKSTPTLNIARQFRRNLNSFPRKAYLNGTKLPGAISFRSLSGKSGIRKRGCFVAGQILSNTLIGHAASFYHFFLFDENFNSGTLRLSKRRRPLCAQCVPPAQYQAAVPPLAAVA